MTTQADETTIASGFEPILAPTSPIPEPETLDAEALLKLPVTAVLEVQLARALTTPHPVERERATRSAERRLRWGQARDAIQYRRPEGCICLGVGGLPVFVQGVGYGAIRRYYGDDYDHDFVFDTYCGCPDGRRIQAEHRARRIAARGGIDAETARRRQLLTQAGIPPQYADCTFDSYPQSAATSSAVAQIRRWAMNDANPFLLIWGEYGRGKTGLSISALRARVLEHDDTGLFAALPDLLHHARRLIPENGMHQLIEDVKRLPVLVLDDVAAEKASEFVDQTLFVILDYRKSHQLRTVCTSNLDPAALGEYVGKRIMWRVLDSAEVVHLNGPNLRDRQPATAANGRRA
jgi:DNA replication protein DnaC